MPGKVFNDEGNRIKVAGGLGVSFLHMRQIILLFPAFVFPLTGWAEPVSSWQPVETPWPRELGTHRVILQVDAPLADSPAMAARIEWRRRDAGPAQKAVLVYDLKTGQPVTRVAVERVTPEEGTLIFEPTSGAGEYAVYFLPVKVEGGAFPVSHYLPAPPVADEAWQRQHGPASGSFASNPQAKVVRWEAISAHDAWNAMEIIASDPEIKAGEAGWAKGVALTVADPEQRVRMFDRLSRGMAQKLAAEAGPKEAVIKARPGEQLVFQVVAWPFGREVTAGQVEVRLAGPGDAPRDAAGPGWLGADELVCLNTQRTDWNGVSQLVPLQLAKGTVQPLWFSVEVPRTAGQTRLMLVVRDGQFISEPLPVTITATGEPIADHGDADPQGLSRLRWLNSTTAVDDELVKGYTPLVVKGRTISCLGRDLELGADGLPVQIRSYFNKAVTKVMDQPTMELLKRPMAFSLTTAQGHVPDLTGSGLIFTHQTPGVVEWTAQLAGPGVQGQLTGRMEGDGSVKYRVAMETSGPPLALDNISLQVVRGVDSLDYILGLQQETGALPAAEGLQWNWQVANKNQDSLWLGAVNGGLRLQLKAENYVRPSVNIHYQRRPLNDPSSWNASGKGGITLTPLQDAGVRELSCHSGPVTLAAGRPLHFDFDLLITPFHTLRTQEQWTDRYYHTGGLPRDYQKYLDGARTAGANVINLHQGNWLNPYINYPFLTAGKLRDFSEAAHARGMRAKFYYTVRELSNWCPELFAFRSLGDEILMSGKGGGHPWGEEHLGGNYWQAWYEPTVDDVSFLTQPMSRFHNYYIEGLRWLCENAGCDGIYLDDIAYDRSIMLRARKVLDRFSPRGGLIDLHSWNEFHEGGAWAHCPNLFMDSLPFVDRIWFGEGHHYTGPPPEHFLVELSGIPFGLMGEMLEGGGNPWFGLVHGMTGRLGWQGDPRAVWQLWDDFGVREAEFIGWWAGEDCPVRSADPLVKATVWKKAGATLLAVANFSKVAKQTVLSMDWKALGLDPAKAKLYAPPIPGLKQRSAQLAPDQALLLKPYAGAVYLIDEKDHAVAAVPAPDAPGELLTKDDFSHGLDSSWTPVLADAARDGAQIDAGYVLRVPANLHAWLERSLPENAGSVSARLWQDGHDEGQQWGPGLALVWPDGRTLRANIRQDGRLAVAANGNENIETSISVRAPVEFTLRWDKDQLKVMAAGPAMGDLAEVIASFPRSQFPGQPSRMRVGKMPSNAGPHDHDTPGKTGFNRIEWVRIHGAP